MALADEFDALYDSAQNPNVQSVVYTPYGGTGSSVSAIIMHGGGMRIVRGKILDRTTDKTVVQIRKSEVATIDEGRDTVTIDGATYLVRSILGYNQVVWQLGLEQ